MDTTRHARANPVDAAPRRRIPLWAFDLFILIFVAVLGLWTWKNSIVHIPNVREDGFEILSLGQPPLDSCNIPQSQIKANRCTKGILIRDEDSLLIWTGRYDNQIDAFDARNLWQNLGFKVISVGSYVFRLDSTQNLFWDREAELMLRNSIDPRGEISEQSLRPFPRRGLIGNSEIVNRDTHLGFRTAKPWLCRSYSVKAGDMQVCAAHFNNQEQCLVWQKNFGKAAQLDHDSLAGIWSSKDNLENAYLSCRNNQGLSIAGNIDILYLEQWGQEISERLRLFPDWDE